MASLCFEAKFARMTSEELGLWAHLPTAIVADSMNRSGAMTSAIKPVRAGMRLLGQARTASVMVGDNGVLHLALPQMAPGEVLVIDAGGSEEVALWGSVLSAAACKRDVAGVVLDGAARDAAELRKGALPVFCRGFTPRGPHKGFGGAFDLPASVGGVAVSPGDIVIGDDDGVVVVPLARKDLVYAACLDNIRKEVAWLEQISQGAATSDLLGIPGFVDG